MNQENLLEKLKNFITAFIEINEVNLPLPTIISSALINCSPNAPEFSGSGFKDFTSYTNHRNQILVNSTDEFIAIVNIFAELLHNEKPEELLGLMQNASHCYREFKKQNLE
jgi:hypothetical protein